jgi:hypothetical protein
VNSPKTWDGGTAAGESLVRRLDALPEPIGTLFAGEDRSDGTPAEVMTKVGAGRRDVFIEGEESERPDLTTGIAAMRLLYGPKQRVLRKRDGFDALEAAGMEPFGNTVFVGDGLIACAAIHKVITTPGVTASFDRVGLTLSKASGGRAALIGDFALGAVGFRIRSASVIPLGWRDASERYAFALVVYENVEKTGCPRIWIGGTGSRVLTECASGLGFTWPSLSATVISLPGGVPYTIPPRLAYAGPVCCTGPGRLELFVLLSDAYDHDIISISTWVDGGHNGYGIEVAPVESDLCFTLRSDDFGASWATTTESGVSADLTQIAFDKGADVHIPTVGVLTVDTVFYSRIPAVFSGRGGGYQPAFYGSLMIGAGGNSDDVFLVLVGTHHTEADPPGPFVSIYDLPMPVVAPLLYKRSGSGAFVRQAWVTDDAGYHSEPFWATAGSNRGSGLAPFTPSELFYDARMILSPIPEFPGFGQPGASDSLKGIFQQGWGSTGPGAMWVTFCGHQGSTPSAPNNELIFIATPDGGTTWLQYTIPDTGIFAAYCTTAAKLALAATDATPARPAELGQLAYLTFPSGATAAQVWRFTRKFEATALYNKGKEVPENISLANFGQRYVHPGFPGAYDEPRATP